MPRYFRYMEMQDIKKPNPLDLPVSLSMITFADVISIEINVKRVKSAKLTFVYNMVNQNGILVCTAVSEHSFLSKDGGFVNLKRDYSSFFNLLKEHSVMQ